MYYEEEEIVTPAADDGGVDLSEDNVEDSEALPESLEEEGEEVEE